MSVKLILKKPFAPMFWTQFLGALNDNIFKNALVLIITYKSISLFGLKSEALVAAAGGIFIFPYFIFSAMAGQLADKKSKSTLVVLTKVYELLIMGLAVWAFLGESYQFLILLLFCMGAQSAFFSPLKLGILPELVPREQLVATNAYTSSGTFVAILSGTLIGGALINNINVLCFVLIGVSLVGLVTSKVLKHTPASDESLKMNIGILRPTKEVMKIAFSDKKMFQMIMGMSWFWFFGASILSLIPVLSRDVLMVNEEVATSIMACFTLGMGVGCILCGKICGTQSELGLIPLACLGMSLATLDLAWVCWNWQVNAPSLMGMKEFIQLNYWWRPMVDVLVLAAMGGLYIVTQAVFIQLESPAKILSRILATNNVWNALLMVSAALVVMLFHKWHLSLGQILFILGLLGLVMTVIVFVFHSMPTLRYLFHLGSNLFYDVEVVGRENIPTDKKFIVVSNHQSYIDWAFLLSGVSRPIHFLIDFQYFKKVGSRKAALAGLIPIATRRESEEIMKQAFEKALSYLHEGNILGLFPEGTLTRDGQLNRFQPGVSQLAKKAQVSVLPVILDGLWGSFFSHSPPGILKGGKFWSFKKRKVKVRILPAIAPEDFDLKELEQKMRKELEA